MVQTQETVEPKIHLGTKKFILLIGIIPALKPAKQLYHVTCSQRVETRNKSVL